MPKALSDEHIAVMMLTTPPVNPAAMTVDEWTAGTALECRLMDLRLSPTASDTVQQAEMCIATNAAVPTKSNYEGTATVFRYLSGAGVADTTNDVAWAAMKVKGTALYLAVREGPVHDAAGAVKQEYSYFEVLTDNPQVPSDRSGYIRREIPLLVQKAVLDKELVAGS